MRDEVKEDADSHGRMYGSPERKNVLYSTTSILNSDEANYHPGTEHSFFWPPAYSTPINPYCPFRKNHPLWTNHRKRFVAFMSSAEQATSSTSNDRLITDALENYAKITGNDLSKNSSAAALEQSDSPEAILKILQEREKAFKEYREGSRRLINCLSPVVNVLQAFSSIFGEAFGLVSHPTHTIGSHFLTCLC